VVRPLVLVLAMSVLWLVAALLTPVAVFAWLLVSACASLLAGVRMAVPCASVLVLVLRVALAAQSRCVADLQYR
jgi:hypothetical protein